MLVGIKTSLNHSQTVSAILQIKEAEGVVLLRTSYKTTGKEQVNQKDSQPHAGEPWSRQLYVLRVKVVAKMSNLLSKAWANELLRMLFR